MNFTAFDVETAQGKKWSICQIGLVEVVNGQIENEVSYLVQPPKNEYAQWNTTIHGINSKMTKDAPTFEQLWHEIKHFIEGKVVVAHSIEFDKDALLQTLEYYNIPAPDFVCQCTYQLTGLKLNEAVQALDVDPGIHHDALSDAKACALIYLKLLRGEKLDPNKIKVKIDSKDRFAGHEHLSGDVLKPDLEGADEASPFFDKKVVFTGVLSSMDRKEAADIVKKMGADINTSISKKTDYVITGSEPGPSKMRKIDGCNNSGASIEIIYEEKFLSLIQKYI